jgi:NitT/TauT family transport system ATP-binding protein
VKRLSCQGVGKVWTSPRGLSVEALREVSFTVRDGQFMAVLGPSGCGKSTLLELIAGLEPLSSGRILVDDVPIAGPSSERCMLFQEHSLFPWLSVGRNVAYGLAIKGVAGGERTDRVARMLERVGLTAFASHFPHQLSGGMKQRAAIARALVTDPAVLLMDEPFAALDFQTRVLMQRFLLEVWEGFGTTILFVTHHIDEAVLLADRVLVMSASPGRILEEVTIDLPRPRSYTSPQFNDYRVRFTAALEREVMQTYAAPTGHGP